MPTQNWSTSLKPAFEINKTRLLLNCLCDNFVTACKLLKSWFKISSPSNTLGKTYIVSNIFTKTFSFLSLPHLSRLLILAQKKVCEYSVLSQMYLQSHNSHSIHSQPNTGQNKHGPKTTKAGETSYWRNEVNRSLSIIDDPTSLLSSSPNKTSPTQKCIGIMCWPHTLLTAYHLPLSLRPWSFIRLQSTLLLLYCSSW